MVRTWEEEVARINALPEIEKREAIFSLSICWEIDQDILRDMAMLGEMKFNAAEYRQDCYNKLMDAFGTAGVFMPFDKELYLKSRNNLFKEQ